MTDCATWNTFENATRVWWDLVTPNYYTKAGTIEANHDFLGKPEGMICRNLVPGEDFRIGDIRCLK